MLAPERVTQFKELIAAACPWVPEKSSGTIKLRDAQPSTIAAKFEELSPVSHHYNETDGWSIYSKDQYQKIKSEKELDIYLRRFMERCGVEVQKKKYTTIEMVRQTSGNVKDVRLALQAQEAVHILPSLKAPSSFNNALNPDNTIAVLNGLLDLTDTSKPVMHAFTPNFYTFNYLPVEYNPTRKAPRWQKEMLGFYYTEDDVNIPDMIAQDVIHSWQKRFMLRKVNPHKIFALIGDPRSGKSSVGRVTKAIIGAGNVSSLSITSLTRAHGLFGLMNKQLGIMWDASIGGRQGDTGKAVEILKNISGQDPITVNPKGRDTIDLDQLQMNILMIANEPANLKDSTGALASRFTFLQTTQTFLGHEDQSLEDHVIAHELPGILNLMLAAPDTVIEHPKDAMLQSEFAEMSSPYIAFANSCCITGDDTLFIPIDILWLYYCDWCEQNKHRSPSAQAFKVKFFSSVRGLKRYRPTLSESDVEMLENDHNLANRPGPKSDAKLDANSRPRCFRGIHINKDRMGRWLDRKNDCWSGQSPSTSDLYPGL